MNHRSLLLSLGLSLVTLPAFSQSLVSSEKYSDNPMDGVGVAHNAYAGCMAANYDQTGKTTPIEVVVYRCGIPTQGDPEAFIRKYTDMANNTRPDPKLSFVENMNRYRENYNAQQFSYFERIDKVLVGSTSPEEADRGLKALEDQAIKELGRTDGDLAVLGVISTGRHSIELWTKDHPVGEAATQRGIPWALIGQIAGADMSGYASGANICGKVCGYVNAAVQSVVAVFN
ncbi:hypothetical protein [Dyella sp. GSA-30]|uniref:hypothetical protein n=1 Tax=Dyella sp. GSA-30 TaxID=2994496 RepID=UPI00248F8F1E|nr:hypothetical protein [Dyella sp. GSA-30]BDU19681.1 hypothetical protein DYGSA30_11380 [Dyella sp. GSA-30]